MPDSSPSLWSIERVVVLLSPIFTGLAAAIVGWIAIHFPGHPRLDAAGVRDLMVAGAVLAGAAVLKWLHGRQKPDVAQLNTKGAMVAAAATATEWLEQHYVELKGPPGAQGPGGGPSPEQVRAIVREEWGGLLQRSVPVGDSPDVVQ